MNAVRRLNHAVLFVRDAKAASAFYQEAFGFVEAASEMGGQAIFLRSQDTDNHHDLGLFAVGPDAPRPPRGSVGLYHLAWEVASIDDLVAMADRLGRLRALTGTSDHGVSKSLYGRDIDGNEFEVMWRVPRDDWGDDATRGVVRPLDLDREVVRYGSGGSTRQRST
jgi:catechol-2,3-dioxygenase